MIDTLINFAVTMIDLRLLLATVLLSAWIKKYLKAILPKVLIAYKVVVISFVLSVIFYYLILLPERGSAIAGMTCLITYLAATNFYNLLYAPIENKIKSYLEK